MTRRECLALVAAAPAPSAPSILVHEHILVDFAGAALASPTRYDAAAVFAAALPRLRAIADLGCRRFLDCTPNFLGRDPRLLRRLADASGIDIWTNTGLYAAGNYKFLPEFVQTESAEQLAQRWIREVQQKVDGVRPQFIKIGVNRGPLGPLDRKVVEAAGRCSKETGLTIAAHTGDGAAAVEELDILTRYVPASRFVWVHAQNELDHAIHEQVARAGAWVEFDGISPKSARWHRQCVETLAQRGWLKRILISQDSGWYHVGEPGGGEYRGYTYLYTDFLPLLPDGWRKTLLWDNPREAFGR